MAGIHEELRRATSSGLHSLQDKCSWADLFSKDDRQLLADRMLLINAATIAATTGLLYFWSFLALENHINECSYRNLYNYAFSMHLRLILPIIVNFMYQFFNVWFLSGYNRALIETYLQVLEIEALTHLCIERYVYAKYNTNGWQINRDHYVLYIYLCFFFAALYSFSPYYGIGDYAPDFACDIYTMDMILPNSWKRYAVLTIFFLRSVKPIIMCACMLKWARELELKYTPQMKKRGDVHYTQLVIRIAMWNFCLWMPLAFVRGFVLVTQLMWGEIMVLHPDTISWAKWIYEVSPVCVTVLIVMENIRMSGVAVNSSGNDETGTELKQE
ncbi:uncharacterized protein LOC126377851 [Pectinophora gossypiella]|uniref:uncharacterized protein LOC126377851 n=1 Tax=Pectinophora gossypiella TaxID=13191 RepID=UPI00214E8120|nr:uncharacterized protein LOC126377851 [Pectinophora gossypiella]